MLVHIDASGEAVGAILAQKDDQQSEYVCNYASRMIKESEKHYGISEKECLAVVWAIRYFRIYLYGIKFQVVTDHSALIWLMSIKDPSGRLARWSLYLQIFDFEIIHRKGTKHSNVDALSRPVLMVGETEWLENENEDEISDNVQPDPYEDANPTNNWNISSLI